MLLCSLLVEKHYSNSNLKNGDEEIVGVDFQGIFSLKLTLMKAIGEASSFLTFSSGDLGSQPLKNKTPTGSGTGVCDSNFGPY